MLGDNELPVRVERQAVGADGPEPSGVALEHRGDQGACPVLLGPLVDDVVAHVGEDEHVGIPDPDRPFDEYEPVGQLLDSSVGGNDVVESRVDTEDGPDARSGLILHTGPSYDEEDQHARES